MFYDSCSPIRYDPTHPLEKKQAFAVAAERIEAGEAPEAVGLPNIGTPEPVPPVNLDEAPAQDAAGKGQ
jgi:hypothetical protein